MAKVSDSSDDLMDDNELCLICCGNDLKSERGITPCNHNSVCGPCHIRLRYLHSDLRCPVCKTSNDRIIVDADCNNENEEPKIFDNYEIWGDELGQDFIFREDVKIFFREPYYDKEVTPLFSLACKQRGCNYVSKRGLKSLSDHLRTKHTMSFCNLCVEAKRDFISNLPRFRPEQLKYHQSKGDGKSSGFKGHPICEFCRPKRFYDLTKLHEHLNKQHYKCHVCERQNNPNQFFKDYDKLAIHFDKQHFLCHDPQCLAARFVVFENEIDLRAHEISTHGTSRLNSSSTKINLEFRVRRSGFDGSGYEDQNVPTEDDFQFGLNGEVFVPESLPGQQNNNSQLQENEPEISDPTHAARTAEMRAHAAQIRRSQSNSELKEDFPTLGIEGNNEPLAGWTAEGRRVIQGNRRAITEDAFPSLQSTATSSATRNIAINSNRSLQRSTQARRAARPYSNIIGSTQSVSSTTTSLSRTRLSSNTVRNERSTLSAENFPSLGGGNIASRSAVIASTPARPMTSVLSAPRQNAINRAPTRAMRPAPTASDFPALGGTSTYAAAENFARKNRKDILKPKARDRPSADILKVPTPTAGMDAKEQLAALKSILGPTNYKKLKKLTIDFASNVLAHEQYIDQAAETFPEGKKDADFWNFMPALIESCPDEGDGRNNKTFEYMATVRIAVDIDDGWAPPPPQPPPPPMQTPLVASISRVSIHSTPRTSVYAKKNKTKVKNSWGSNSSVKSIATNTKLPNGMSVVKDAMREPTQRGSATKYMAKMNADEKKMKQQMSQQAGTSKKSKAKKKKNELRDLAFGK